MNRPFPPRVAFGCGAYHSTRRQTRILRDYVKISLGFAPWITPSGFTPVPTENPEAGDAGGAGGDAREPELARPFLLTVARTFVLYSKIKEKPLN